MKKLRVMRIVRGALPIVQWSRGYNLETAVSDLVAGVTVALTLVPQSIAYASLAGFEPQYGLYASFAGALVYALLGTVPQINIGPTALLSLLTYTYTSGTNTDFAILLCFFAGILQLLAGVAQLGFLVDFVSLPVVSGFTSAAAITIASSQIKGLLGLRFNSESFVGTWKEVYSHIGDTRLADTLLSIGCCSLLFSLQAAKDIKVNGLEEKSNRRSKILKRSLWFVGVGRNAAVVVLAAIVAFCTFREEESPFILTGRITPGIPIPKLPAFTTTVGNQTYTTTKMLSHLGSGLVVVPLVGIIANVAVAKAFANGNTIAATHEIIVLGICNIVGAFFRSFPTNGSFTRSAVSQTSGVRTPGAGFYTGIIVILTLLLLTPYFFYIPRAALASVIVCAVLHMVDIDIVKKLWRTNKLDLIPLFGTVIACLAFGVEIGLGCGVAVDILLLLFYQSRPSLSISFVKDPLPHYTAHPKGGLHFAGADRIRKKLTILPASSKDGARAAPEPLVIYCDSLSRIDFTALETLKAIVQDCKMAQRRVVFFSPKPSLLSLLRSTLGDSLLTADSGQDLKALLADPTSTTVTASQEGLTTIRLEENMQLQRVNGDTHL